MCYNHFYKNVCDNISIWTPLAITRGGGIGGIGGSDFMVEYRNIKDFIFTVSFENS